MNPLRNLLQPPRKIIAPHLREGMTVLDFGAALGFFTLPMARTVGPTGTVYALDVQPEMTRRLQRRAARKGLADRIHCQTCRPNSLALPRPGPQFDFILAMFVMHETEEPGRILCEMYEHAAEGCTLAISEPPGHISDEAWQATRDAATAAGWREVRVSTKPKRFDAVYER